jgi:hypothetical protein
VANALGWLLEPVALLPGWLSATVLGAVSGVLLLGVFKHTSAMIIALAGLARRASEGARAACRWSLACACASG